MKITEKIDRLRYLRSIDFPSDQELEEIEQLEEEIKIEIQNIIPSKKEQTPTKKYRGIISGRIEKWRDERRERNKATPEKLHELQMEARLQELKARVAVAKKKQKENKTSRFDFHIPGKIFTEEGQSNYQSFKNKVSKPDKKDYSALGI